MGAAVPHRARPVRPPGGRRAPPRGHPRAGCPRRVRARARDRRRRRPAHARPRRPSAPTLVAVEPAAGLRRILDQRLRDCGRGQRQHPARLLRQLPVSTPGYDMVVSCSAFTAHAFEDPERLSRGWRAAARREGCSSSCGRATCHGCSRTGSSTSCSRARCSVEYQSAGGGGLAGADLLPGRRRHGCAPMRLAFRRLHHAGDQPAPRPVLEAVRVTAAGVSCAPRADRPAGQPDLRPAPRRRAGGGRRPRPRADPPRPRRRRLRGPRISIDGVALADVDVDTTALQADLFRDRRQQAASPAMAAAYRAVYADVPRAAFRRRAQPRLRRPRGERRRRAGICRVLHTLHLPPRSTIADAINDARRHAAPVWCAAVSQAHAAAWSALVSIDAVLRNGVPVDEIRFNAARQPIGGDRRPLQRREGRRRRHRRGATRGLARGRVRHPV